MPMSGASVGYWLESGFVVNALGADGRGGNDAGSPMFGT
jgi:hypothetical protein